MYACTLVEADTSDGFRVTDSDPNVCDPDWLHGLAAHMLLPQLTIEHVDQGVAARTVGFRDPGHFEAAVRCVPRGVLSAAGR